jgi:predicted SprT family Zn-dependent metalloprotease
MAGLKLTPEVLRAAYAYLDETQPFAAWNLPDPDDVKFVVTSDAAVQGYAARNPFEIGISRRLVGSTDTLMFIMAHEMVHFHADRAKERNPHGPMFRRAAKQVCDVHLFDIKNFI